MKFKFLLILVIWLGLVGVYHFLKVMPQGLDYKGEEVDLSSSEIDFLYDLTYENEKGEIVYEQEIFDTVLDKIQGAQQYILIDAFLFNSYQLDGSDPNYRELSRDLTEALLEKKKKIPDIKIDLITDPINLAYDDGQFEELDELRMAGVNVVVTDLKRLRDSNWFYSPIWRTFFQWFENVDNKELVKHPFSDYHGKVTVSSYLELLNMKANHRKVFVTDDGGQMVSIITSANPHDGSSGHSNIALLAKGEVWESVYETEKKVAEISGGSLSDFDFKNLNSSLEGGESKVRIISESQIKQEVLSEINGSFEGEKIKIAQFYFSDRDLMKGLIEASRRGVEINIVLDPNKDAFGYEKNGIPNRQVAWELVDKSDGRIDLRWYNTNGEQFHSKLFMVQKKDGINVVVLGSANFTRRNLNNYNLELSSKVVSPADSEFSKETQGYFARIWNNENCECSLNYDVYKDHARWKRAAYLIQEGLGLSSF